MQTSLKSLPLLDFFPLYLFYLLHSFSSSLTTCILTIHSVSRNNQQSPPDSSYLMTLSHSLCLILELRKVWAILWSNHFVSEEIEIQREMTAQKGENHTLSVVELGQTHVFWLSLWACVYAVATVLIFFFMLCMVNFTFIMLHSYNHFVRRLH